MPYIRRRTDAGSKEDGSRHCKECTDRSKTLQTGINEGLEKGMDEAIVVEEKLFGGCFESYDQKEGMAAFLEKRKVEAFLNK